MEVARSEEAVEAREDTVSLLVLIQHPEEQVQV